jgi:hypothetical protein
MNEKDKNNKEFDNLVRIYSNKGILIKDETQYKNLIEWAAKNEGSIIKKIDYGYYAIIFFIIILIAIILLIMYYTEKITVENLEDLINPENESPFIEIEEYENEFIE